VRRNFTWDQILCWAFSFTGWGGFASGRFYVPDRGVKLWAWEIYCFVVGFFSWILAPGILALWMTSELTSVLREAPSQSLFWAYTFGVLWGWGGLTFGLTMRYLGLSLGMAVALGYSAAFGTLMPPIFRGQFATEVLGARSGLTILAGVGICMLRIVFAGMAGVSKESDVGGVGTHVNQGVEQGVASRHLLWSDERLLRLWTGSRRPHSRNYRPLWNAGALAETPRPGRSSTRRIYRKYNLVPSF
jgi:hypothetical protein